MKFLVLCVCELQEPNDFERRAASRVLEAAGFRPAGFEDANDESDPQSAFTGVFHATSADALRERLREHLDLRLFGYGLRASVSLCIHPAPYGEDSAAENSTRQDVAV